jgi:hypothetical protein
MDAYDYHLLKTPITFERDDVEQILDKSIGIIKARIRSKVRNAFIEKDLVRITSLHLWHKFEKNKYTHYIKVEWVENEIPVFSHLAIFFGHAIRYIPPEYLAHESRL